MHGIGTLTPEAKIHVVPLHKIIAQPGRYEVLAVGDSLIGALDMPDRLLKERPYEDSQSGIQ